MPIDGVSFQNSGVNINTPAEVTAQAAAAANKEAEKKIKDIEQSDKMEADSDENEDNERDLEGRDTSDTKDGRAENEELEKVLDEKKKFLVKFNPQTEMVEMIDAQSGGIIETVTPEDLLKLLSKSKAFSGVFVDRKI